jgi:hypothetical protein
MQATDFWGEIETTAVRTPLSILREQAAALGPRTKNLVEAKVQTTIYSGYLIHSFNLVVPSVDSYTYQLFQIEHPVDLYPIHVKDSPPIILETEDEFTAWLRERLSAERTRKILSNLLAQAQS